LATVHDGAETKAWFFPALAERQRRGDDAAARAEFLRRLDTPGRVVIELAPVRWITYDGNRLEAALRGVDYHEGLMKRSRNLTIPPAGLEMTTC
jgi:hypothetical protein